MDMKLRQRVDSARDFPTNTCPASRHAQMIGEALTAGSPLTEELDHCGESILATVAALYETRTECTRLRAAIQQTLDENGHLADGENCTLIVLKRALKTPNV